MSRLSPSLIVISLTVFLDALGIGLIIPVGPKLIAMVQGLPTEGAETETSLAVGFLAATYAAMQFIFAPILGSLSDQFGRRPVILISLLGSGIDYFIAAMAPNLAVLFVTRAINGISGANITTCSAYIADVTPPEKRAAGFGVMYGAFGLGFVLGPVTGGYLGEYDIRLPWAVAGVLTVLNWLYGWFVLPESLAPQNRRAFSWRRANPLGAIAWLAKHRMVFILAATLLLVNVAQYSLHATWVLSMGMRFGWNTAQVGWSLFVVGISGVIVQGGLARRIIPALGERVCLVAGLAIAACAYAGYGLATHGWMIYVIIAVASLGGVAGPSLQGVISKAVPANEQGLLQGALNGLQNIAGVIGYLLGSAAFRFFTRDGAPIKLPGASFLLGSTLTVLSILPVIAVWKRLPRTVKQVPVEQNPGMLSE